MTPAKTEPQVTPLKLEAEATMSQEVTSAEMLAEAAGGATPAEEPREMFSTPEGGQLLPQSHSTPAVGVAGREQVPPSTDTPGKEDLFYTPAASRPAPPDLSTSLRAGAFDTSAHLLRTTSLPDLRGLFDLTEGPAPGPLDDVSTEGDSSSNQGNEVQLSGNEEEDPAGQEDDEGEDSEEEDPACERPNAEQGEGDVPVIKEQGEPPDEEGVWSDDSDDEDLQQLVQTLQTFVDEAKSPVHTRSPLHSVRPETPTALLEEWQYSDEEEDPAHSSHDSAPSPAPSVFSNLEETRMQLECSLGLGTLLQAYRLIQALYEEEGEGPDERGFPVEQLAAVVGEDHTHHCPALIGLVLADSAYSDTNTEGKGGLRDRAVELQT